MPKFAFVIPRYAASIGGGAETLMRSLALALKDTGVFVDIITTCAKDHRTWDNYYQEGSLLEDGLKVDRFPVDQRDVSLFLECEAKLAKGLSLSNQEQISWLKNSVNSSLLYEHLLKTQHTYDLIFFAPYLFGTSFWGAMLVKEKAILVPCLHDEAYAYQPIMRTLFRSVKGLMWNAFPEGELAKRIYNIDNIEEKGREVGMGFDEIIPTSMDSHTENSPSEKKFFLYSGRKETGKGLDSLIRFYSDYRTEHPLCPKLLLVGSGTIDFMDSLPDGIEDLGFVSEDKKVQLMHDALCLIQPSVNESFSIVLMEAWGQGTPVLVNSDCDVTSYHVNQSQGGWTYRSFGSFSEALSDILENEKHRVDCGINGKSFVRSMYSWDAVIKRFNKATELWLS